MTQHDNNHVQSDAAMGAAQILKQLEGFPQELDLASAEPVQAADVDEVTEALKGLALSNPTPEARNSIVQASVLVPPSRTLEKTQLAWITDQGASSSAVTEHLAAGLGDGTYDPRQWLRAAAETYTERGRNVLTAWGMQKFDAFLSLCKDEFDNPELRLGIISVLQFIILRTPYSPETPLNTTRMYQLSESAFFPRILDSLMLDTSNHLFPVALSVLVTILPFSLTHLTDSVPLLMVILGRAICWRDRPFVDTGASAIGAVTKTPAPAPDRHWRVARHGSDDLTQATPTEKRVIQLLVIGLYGACPSNVIAFIRDQKDYLSLKKVPPVYDVPWSETWEPGVLSSRLVPLIADFQLHPSIITHTSRAELEDDKRWDRYDPSEFVSMAHLMSHADDPDSAFEFFKTPKAALLDPRPVSLTESDLNSPTDTDDVRRLKEENELLRLESLYAERLRKQLIYHIGRLHRNTLRFNSDEAEIHTFVNKLKEQTHTIKTLTLELSQQRDHASAAQQKHVKWQEQLRDKVSGFREERRKWTTDATSMRTELAETQATVQKQREELATVKNERFIVQNQLLEVTPKLRHLSDYEARMKQLTDAQLLWDDDVQRLRDAEASVQAAQGRIAELQRMLRAREQVCFEQAKAMRVLESRVTQVTTASLPPSRPPSPPKQQAQDLEFYLHVAENATRKAQRLERENLELQVEVERLQRVEISEASAASSLF